MTQSNKLSQGIWLSIILSSILTLICLFDCSSKNEENDDEGNSNNDHSQADTAGAHSSDSGSNQPSGNNSGNNSGTNQNSDSGNDSGNQGYPHTVNNSGVMHGQGIADPMANCTPCHGQDLKGAGSAPSCYKCHGKLWSDNGTDPSYPHTVNKEGVMHGQGIADPMANCTTCHGQDLKGAGSAPSCYKCHGAVWNDDDDDNDD